MYLPTEILTIEIQEKAVRQQKLSLENSHLQENIQVLLADLRSDSLKNYNEYFDVITCNPPYKISGTGAKNDVKFTIADIMRICVP